MNKRLFRCMAAICGFVLAGGMASGDPGLLIVAHGSSSAAWNEPVLQLEKKIGEKLRPGGAFREVRTAFLEFAEPDVPTRVKELEQAGCDRIVAVPLFIAPSGHSHFDVPAVLGVYDSPSIRESIAEEGGTVAVPKVPVVLTGTMAEGDCLDAFALEEVRALSKAPKDEGIVFLLHGDGGHSGLIEDMMRRIGTRCCGEAGIGYADWASIAVGQEYAERGIPAIQSALERKKRVLVIGLYVSTSAKRIHEQAMQGLRDHAGRPQADPFKDRDVAFSDRALISSPAMLQWVVDSALHAAGSVKSAQPTE
jgi:hypothetical protein